MALLGVGLMLLTPVGSAAGSVRSEATVVPAVLAPPATLAATGTGTTILGESATSAQTRYSPGLTAQHVLTVDVVDGAWDARLELVGQSGGDLLDSVSLELCLAETCTTQVTLSGTTITQEIGPAVAAHAGDSLTIRSTATKASLEDLVMDLRLVFDAPEGGTTLRYAHQLTLT